MMINKNDPLLENLPLPDNVDDAISHLIEMLGYSSHTFKKMLISLLIEELLDRLTLAPEEIEKLRLEPDHIHRLKSHLDKRTGVNWSLEATQQFWQRIRLLDTKFKRESIPFSRKLQVLATRPHRCENCGKEPPEVNLHVDHIYAASKGGPNELWNLRLLCSECNIVKSNHLDWRLSCR